MDSGWEPISTYHNFRSCEIRCAPIFRVWSMTCSVCTPRGPEWTKVRWGICCSAIQNWIWSMVPFSQVESQHGSADHRLTQKTLWFCTVIQGVQVPQLSLLMMGRCWGAQKATPLLELSPMQMYLHFKTAALGALALAASRTGLMMWHLNRCQSTIMAATKCASESWNQKLFVSCTII